MDKVLTRKMFKERYFKSLKPTKKGGGRIIQPGGGFSGN